MNILRKRVKEMGVAYVNSLTEKELKSFLSDEEFSLGWRWKYIAPVLMSKKDKHMTTDCLLSPVRNLTKLRNKNDVKKIETYLSRHPVIITLTTSPVRLSKLPAVFATLDLTYVTKINVCLPLEYGGKKEKYGNIPDDIINFPKVEIVRLPEDFGPISKMLPTIEGEPDDKAMIISIDDDVAYPLGLINELIYQKIIKYPKAVLTTGTQMPFFSSVKGMSKYWPDVHQRRPFVDLIEGWKSVLYTPNLVNTKCMIELGKIGKPCFLSDDFVISYALSYAGVKRVSINNMYAENPHPYEYGTGEDALHAGAGLSPSKRKKYIKNDDQINFEKYGVCLEKIREYIDIVRSDLGKEDSCGFRSRR